MRARALLLKSYIEELQNSNNDFATKLTLRAKANPIIEEMMKDWRFVNKNANMLRKANVSDEEGAYYTTASIRYAFKAVEIFSGGRTLIEDSDKDPKTQPYLAENAIVGALKIAKKLDRANHVDDLGEVSTFKMPALENRLFVS